MPSPCNIPVSSRSSCWEVQLPISSSSSWRLCQRAKAEPNLASSAHCGPPIAPFSDSHSASDDTTDNYPTVVAFSRIHVVRRLPPVGAAQAIAGDAPAAPPRWPGPLPRQPVFQHGQVNPHALARLVALVQGQQQGVGHVVADGMVHVVGGWAPLGGSALVAGQVGQATGGVNGARPGPRPDAKARCTRKRCC